MCVCCIQEVVQQMDPSEMQATVTKVGWQLGQLHVPCNSAYSSCSTLSNTLISFQPVVAIDQPGYSR
jgi:hypothetical protein